jgi:hypothetical protein
LHYLLPRPGGSGLVALEALMMCGACIHFLYIWTPTTPTWLLALSTFLQGFALTPLLLGASNISTSQAALCDLNDISHRRNSHVRPSSVAILQSDRARWWRSQQCRGQGTDFASMIDLRSCANGKTGEPFSDAMFLSTVCRSGDARLCLWRGNSVYGTPIQCPLG